MSALGQQSKSQREGKLDDVAKDGRALIQKRNAQTGLLDPKN